MKEKTKEIIKTLLLAFGVIAFVLLAVFCAVKESKDKENYMVKRTYELVDKSTSVNTHRYWLIENAVETDYHLVWKGQSGRIITTNSNLQDYHNYQIGKRYVFNVDSRYSESSQLP